MPTRTPLAPAPVGGNNSSFGPSLVDGPTESRIFEELLDAEVLMNPAKLREAARQGIPTQYRATVYRYLLGIASMDKSSEMTFEQMQEEDFKLLETASISLYGGLTSVGSASGVGAVVGASSLVATPSSSTSGLANNLGSFGDPWDAILLRCRSLPKIRSDPALRKKMECTIRALRITNVDASEEDADAVFSLAFAFVLISSTPWDAFHLTEALVRLLRSNLNPLQSVVILREYCSVFLMLFHHTNDTLYTHFHVEEVLPMAWLPDYMRSLLSKQLHPDDHMRLMDVYLADCAETGGFPLHIFVCLALLSIFTEELMELDRTQILLFLSRLPRVNMESVLQRALAIRETVRARELL